MNNRKFRVVFLIEVDVDGLVTPHNKAIETYVNDAVRCWGGGFDPDDPFFGLEKRDITKLKVSRVRREV